jgi:phytol kinase
VNQAEWINVAAYGGLFLFLFLLAEILYHKFRAAVEITRKFVHIGTGVICLTFPFFVGSHWTVLILTIAFFALLITSIQLNLLKSINAVERKTSGSFIFPVVVYITFWAYSIFGIHDMDAVDINWTDGDVGKGAIYSATVYYFLPILILSISDPMAALIGKKWPRGKYKIFGNTKTLMGSTAFFVSALIVSTIFLIPLAESVVMGFLVSFCIAICTTLVEAIGHKGLDNLFIPIATIAILLAFNEQMII